MSGRFKTCEYPYCHKPAVDVTVSNNTACSHRVCEDHVLHDCKEVDLWLREGPKFNGIPDLESLVQESSRDLSVTKAEGLLVGQRRLPRVRPPEWRKIIER